MTEKTKATGKDEFYQRDIDRISHISLHGWGSLTKLSWHSTGWSGVELPSCSKLFCFLVSKEHHSFTDPLELLVSFIFIKYKYYIWLNYYCKFYENSSSKQLRLPERKVFQHVCLCGLREFLKSFQLIKLLKPLGKKSHNCFVIKTKTRLWHKQQHSLL